MEVEMTDGTIDALRDELQRVRIERAGLLSDIEQLKAELARLANRKRKSQSRARGE